MSSTARNVPRVSVVVPNYNHGRYLGKRLESILGQTYQDFELVYLDDASTDDSASVFSAYASHPQVRSVLNTENTGSPFVQWNRGVREARGEYVWIAEADDFADPHLLERLVAVLDDNPHVGLAYCQSWIVDEQDQVQCSHAELICDLHPTRWDTDFIADGRTECACFLARRCTIPNASAVLFRKSVYEAAGGVDETMRLNADWMLWARMLQISDLGFVAEPLNAFRRHAGALTHRTETSERYADNHYAIAAYLLSREETPSGSIEALCEAVVDAWWHLESRTESSHGWRAFQKGPLSHAPRAAQKRTLTAAYWAFCLRRYAQKPRAALGRLYRAIRRPGQSRSHICES